MYILDMSPEEARLEARYQDLIAQYYLAQADFRNAKTECLRLVTVVGAKQEVINVLLPYYPHALTPELLYKINLT